MHALYCKLFGHEDMAPVQDGDRMVVACLRCHRVSEGIPIGRMPQPMSAADIKRVFDDLMEVEMGLGCGG